MAHVSSSPLISNKPAGLSTVKSCLQPNQEDVRDLLVQEARRHRRYLWAFGIGLALVLAIAFTALKPDLQDAPWDHNPASYQLFAALITGASLSVFITLSIAAPLSSHRRRFRSVLHKPLAETSPYVIVEVEIFIKDTQKTQAHDQGWMAYFPDHALIWINATSHRYVIRREDVTGIKRAPFDYDYNGLDIDYQVDDAPVSIQIQSLCAADHNAVRECLGDQPINPRTWGRFEKS